MRDFSEALGGLRRRLEEASGYLKADDLRSRQADLEQEASRADLWDDPDKARQVTSELSGVNDDLELLGSLEQALEDVETLHQLAREESDDSLESEIDEAIADLTQRLDDLELRSLLSGEYDERDAVCEVHSGAGGTDAQDWANMLLRMYLRWAERRGLDVELDEVSAGQEAGISTATFIVHGRHAYGFLQGERGVHRLIRISPFDSQSRRHTAFASVTVVPQLEQDDDAIEIDEGDLRIDTYRSSGAGGQHVNVTDSAVRITHLPTGIVTSVQNERSQHQNKDKALQILRAKLTDLRRQERQQELDALAGDQRSADFANQIRSYFLHPEQRVKDHRTGEEVGNVEGVLDGEVDRFLESYLRWQRESGAAS